MHEELVDIVETFIKLCDELLENGKIDTKLYEELTRNKFDFLSNVERVS